MLTIEDVRTVSLFSGLQVRELEQLVQKSADLHLSP